MNMTSTFQDSLWSPQMGWAYPKVNLFGARKFGRRTSGSVRTMVRSTFQVPMLDACLGFRVRGSSEVRKGSSCFQGT